MSDSLDLCAQVLHHVVGCLGALSALISSIKTSHKHTQRTTCCPSSSFLVCCCVFWTGIL